MNKYYISWVCVCSLSYPECKAHASCCHLWSVRISHIYLLYLTNDTNFEKWLWNMKYVFGFSLQFLSEILLILKRTGRRVIKNIYWSSCGVNVTLVRFFKERWSFFVSFRRILKYHISLKSVQLEPSCFMRTKEHSGVHTKHEQAESRFSQFLRTRPTK